MIILRPGLTLPAIVLLLSTLSACSNGNVHHSDGVLSLKWSAVLPAGVYYGSPALSRDESTVFIGTSSALFGSHVPGHALVALDAVTGLERWRCPLGSGEVRSTPAIAPDGSLYFVVEVRDSITHEFLGDWLWHVSTSGDSLWTFAINPRLLLMEIGHSSPAIAADGTVYVAGDRLYAINPNGSLRWTAADASLEALRNSPVIGNDGTVYFVFHNLALTAFDPDNGSILWSCALGVNDHCFSSPAIGHDGTIVVATNPGIVYAVSPSGQINWTFDLGSVGFFGNIRSSPAIDSAGSIYFGLNFGTPSSAFFALNPNGTLKWVFEPQDLPPDVPPDHFDIYSSPALGNDSLIYFGQEFGRVYALNLVDGSLADMVETSTGITWCSPALVSSGLLYISDMNGHVYAYQTPSMGLDTVAAWPKFRHDNCNTGSTRK